MKSGNPESGTGNLQNMNNKKIFFILLIIALARPAAAFDVALDSNTVKEGGIIKLKIINKDPAKAADIVFQGKKYPAFYTGYDAKEHEYVYTALVPVPLDTSGKEEFTVRCLLSSGVIQEQKEEVAVKALAEDISEVDTDGMLDDDMRDAIHEENGVMREYIDRVSAVKYDLPFIMPVKGVISTGFGASRVYDDGEAEWRHKGIDIAAKLGTPVAAANKGIVVISMEGTAYGNMIIIDHGGGLFTLYFHLSKRIAKKGDRVAKGDIIGEVGSTGLSTGPHLHFQTDLFRIPVNPYGLLGPASPALPIAITSNAKVIY
jgi:hypothetical protein